MVEPVLDDSDDLRWDEPSLRNASPSREDAAETAPGNFSREKDLLRLGLDNFDCISICP